MPKVREGGVVRKDSAATERTGQPPAKCVELCVHITQRDITLVPLGTLALTLVPLGTLALKWEFLVCGFLLSLYE